MATDLNRPGLTFGPTPSFASGKNTVSHPRAVRLLIPGAIFALTVGSFNTAIAAPSWLCISLFCAGILCLTLAASYQTAHRRTRD